MSLWRRFVLAYCAVLALAALLGAAGAQVALLIGANPA